MNRDSFGKEYWSTLEGLLGHIPGRIGGLVRGRFYACFFPPFRGKGAMIGPFTRIRFPWNLEIGENIFIGRNVQIECIHPGDLWIGDNVMIAPYAMIFTAHRGRSAPTRVVRLGGVSCRQVIIENDVWIGGNTAVLPCVRVGKGSTLSACSVINRDIPPYAMVAGNPARVFGYREIGRRGPGAGAVPGDMGRGTSGGDRKRAVTKAGSCSRRGRLFRFPSGTPR